MTNSFDDYKFFKEPLIGGISLIIVDGPVNLSKAFIESVNNGKSVPILFLRRAITLTFYLCGAPHQIVVTLRK